MANQWVFATAVRDMTDHSDPERVIAKAASRVMLVYPMQTDAATGCVIMRAKTVDPTTGQLSYAWVKVYDPDAGERIANDFSFAP